MMKRLLCIIIVVALVSASLHLDEFNNRPIGDVNQDGLVNILDVVTLINIIFEG